MTYDQCRIDKETLILALQNKLREDMETPEDVHYNEGIIDAMKEVKLQYLLEEQKQHTS